MAIITPIDDICSISSQITEPEIAALSAAGVRMIICNRPDGEEPGQPDSDIVSGWAKAHGMTFAHIPVSPGEITLEAADAMRHALSEAGGPAHAYCKSGGRAAALWALASAALGRHSPDDILSRAKRAGFDLAGLKPAIDHLASDR